MKADTIAACAEERNETKTSFYSFCNRGKDLTEGLGDDDYAAAMKNKTKN